MKNTRHRPPIVYQQGVVLIEVMIAVLIFSLGILGVVGLQAAMVKNTSDAKYRAEASFIAQQRIGAMWVDQESLAQYAEEDTDISAWSGLPNGRRTTIRGDASCGGELSCFLVRVTWQQPGSSEVRNVTTVARITE